MLQRKLSNYSIYNILIHDNMLGIKNAAYDISITSQLAKNI